jgi:ribose transport system substrate-binding protein
MFNLTKGKLRLFALLTALVLALSLLSAGCSKNQKKGASEGGAADKSYKIGVNTWGSGVPILDLFGDEAEYALKTFGCTTTRMSDDFTSDKELQNIQNMCSAGVDGICMQGAAVSTVPQMAQVCKDAKVPFVLYTFIGDDATREDLAANKPLLCWARWILDMVYDGKVVAEMAYNDGCRTAVIIGGNIGDNNMDQRSQGFTEQFEAMGGKVLAQARCTDASECPTKAEDMLSANMDADCIYAMVGDYIPGSLSAIENSSFPASKGRHVLR